MGASWGLLGASGGLLAPSWAPGGLRAPHVAPNAINLRSELASPGGLRDPGRARGKHFRLARAPRGAPRARNYFLTNTRSFVPKTRHGPKGPANFLIFLCDCVFYILSSHSKEGVRDPSLLGLQKGAVRDLPFLVCVWDCYIWLVYSYRLLYMANL